MNIKIKRTIICMIFFIIAFFALNNVFAKDLVYEAKLDADKYLTYANYVKAYSKGNGEIIIPNNGRGDDITDNFVSDSGYYRTVGITFHRKEVSSYSESQRSFKDQLVYFDISKNNLDPLSLGLYRNEYTQKVRGGGAYVGNNSSNDISDLIYKIDSGNKPDGNNTLVNVQSRTDENYFTENRFRLGPNTVSDLKNSLKYSDVAIEDGFYKVKFSNIISTSNQLFYTSQAMFNHMASVGYEIRNFGMWHKWINMTNYDTYLHDGEATELGSQYWLNQVGKTYWFPAGSVLNEYDNEMRIPAEEPRKIFVKHVTIENGTEKVQEGYRTAILNPGGNEKNISSSLNNITDIGWSEMYSCSESILVRNIENKLNENITSGQKYKLCQYLIYKVDNDGNPLGTPIKTIEAGVSGEIEEDKIWIDSNTKDVTIGNSDNTEKQNYGIVYKYERDSGINTTILVGHVFSNNSTKNGNYDILKKNAVPGYLGTETKSTNVTGTTYDTWLTKYTNAGSLTVSKSTNNRYECMGYKVVKGDSISALKANIITCSSISVKNPSVSASSKKYTLIIFFYKSRNSHDDSGTPDTNPNMEELPIYGWLDFINTTGANSYLSATNQEYSGTSYKYNSKSTIQKDFKKNPDYVTSNNGSLSTYVRTAPFYIKGINIEKKEINTTIDKNVSVKGSYDVEKSSIDAEGNTTTWTETKYTTVSATVKIPVKYYIYKINNCTIGYLSDFTFSDNDNNIGGKLFNGNETNTVNSKYSVSNDLVEATNPKFNITLNISDGEVVASGSDASSARSNAVSYLLSNLEPTSFSYSILDDKVNVGNIKENIFTTEETKGNISDISYYTVSVSGNTNVSGSNNNIVSISTKYDDDHFRNKIRKYIDWKDDDDLQNMTKYTDFNFSNSSLGNNIRENGIRELAGKINYKIVGNTGSYTPTYYISSSGFTDNRTNKKSITFSNATQSITLNNDDTNDLRVRKVDVYTPIKFGDWKDIVKTTTTFDSSIGGGAGNSLVLQADTEFKVTPTFINFSGNNYNDMNTQENVDYCYVMFNFRVKKISGNLSENKEYGAGEKIKIDANSSTSFKTTHDFVTLKGGANNVRIIAVAKNATGHLKNYYEDNAYTNNVSSLSLIDVQNFIGTKVNTLVTINSDNQVGFLTNDTIKGSSNHAVTNDMASGNSAKSLSRLYDFVLTDCTDPAFKNVFRNTKTDLVNNKTNKVYWSGIKYLNIANENSNEINSGEMRSTTDNDDINGIGSNPTRILPLGPYKNTNSTYAKAPKLGYRISYNLKTTGILDNYNDRNIVIVPRYYYVSKKPQFNGIFKFVEPENIKLYYKNFLGLYKELKTYTLTNSSGATVDSRYTISSGSAYNIYYKPNDGYRNLMIDKDENKNTSFSDKNIKVDISKIQISKASMMTTADDYTQVWYGEFKLPNSTIAVEKDSNGKYNVNNPLTDGYIGVIFDIYCVDNNGFTLLYSQNSRNDSGNEIPNASQWDYEGHLSIPTAGQSLSQNLTIQLENGIWQINNDLYQKIKGTVLLYDIDERAANDYD